MKKKIRLLDLGTIEWYKSQTIYHVIAESVSEDGMDTVILCRPDTPYFCIGYHQEFDDIFDRQRINKMGIPVMRREIGGGATYLDSNQFFYQFIFSKENVPPSFGDIFGHFLRVPVSVLKRLGMNAGLRATNEIEVEGKRVAGTGGGFIGNACAVVGNFLIDFNYDAMTDAWSCPSESFRELASIALRENVRTLSSFGRARSYGEIRDIFEDELKIILEADLQKVTLDEATHLRSEKLKEELTVLGEKERQADQERKVLKISADVHIHYERMIVNGSEIRASLLVRNGMIEKIFPDPGVLKPGVTELVGTRLSDLKRRTAIVEVD